MGKLIAHLEIHRLCKQLQAECKALDPAKLTEEERAELAVELDKLAAILRQRLADSK